MTRLFRFLGRLPLWALHLAGWWLGWLAWLLSPTYRQQLGANAHRAGVSLRERIASVGEAGKLVAELPRLWMGAPVPVGWQGAAHIEAAHASGRGVLFLTPHLGCFEITAQAYAERFGVPSADGANPGHPVTVLYRPPRQAWLQPLVNQARDRPGLATAPTTLAGVRQLMRALKSGETVGLLPDQVPPLGLGVWAPFFGQDAYTMTLSGRLAQAQDLQVLLIWGERLRWGRGYLIHVQPAPDAFSPDPQVAAQQVNLAMEGMIRQCPRQYLWGYRRYKAPRKGF